MRCLICIMLLLGQLTSQGQRYDVVIHEIFADPTPAVGLPTVEWIELRNRSTQSIHLQGWRLGDGSGQSGPFPNIVLFPDSLLIVCGSTSVNLMNSFGTCVGLTNFPSLDNENDLVVLRNRLGQVVHAIEYSSKWHQTDLKKEGGWSLEMIDPAHPGLFQPNWRSSTHPSGGTPGKTNAQNGRLEDRDPPTLYHTYSLDSSRLLVLFDEALDSAAMSRDGVFHLSDNREVVEAICLPPLYNRMELRTDWPLRKEKMYTLTNIEATDLAGNRTPSPTSIRTGVPSFPHDADIRINELLFDPPLGGSDYVELLNISKKIIDLSTVYIATRSTNGNLASLRRLTAEPRYFFPDDHVVITAGVEALKRNFFVQQPSWVIHTDAMPSMPDTEGSIVLLNHQGEVLDELRYSDEWHFPLLGSKNGVALERIDPLQKTQEKNNWQSAASTVNFGTPTRRNSQYRVFGSQQSIELSTTVLSPNGDGRDDILQIKFRSEQPGNRLRIRIYHESGVLTRALANTAWAGTESIFNWDGLNERGQQLPTGRYILLAEAFAPTGERSVHKKTLYLWDSD